MKKLIAFVATILIASLPLLSYGAPPAGKGVGKGKSSFTHVSGAKPPGLAKKSKMPYGLQKQNKTPAGWSRGTKTGWSRDITNDFNPFNR